MSETPKIKVAFLIDTIATDKAGTQKQLLETIRRIDRNRFSPTLIVLWTSEWMCENELPCKHVSLGFRGFLSPSIFSVLASLRRCARDQSIDVVHAFFPESVLVLYFAFLGRSKSPVLISGRRDIGLGRDNEPWYHAIYRILPPIVNRKYDGIIANSALVADFVALHERTSRQKIDVVYNGVDVPNFPGMGARQVNQHVGLVIAASLTPVKRHDILFRALAILSDYDDAPIFRLTVLGDGPLRAELESLAAKLGVHKLIEFRGAVTDVFDQLHAAHIGILCSDREGLSNAILEYMSAGLATIATDVGGNAELVTDSTGILVPAEDPESLAQAILELVRDDERRIRFGTNARLKVEEQFTWETAMQQLENRYTQLSRS